MPSVQCQGVKIKSMRLIRYNKDQNHSFLPSFFYNAGLSKLSVSCFFFSSTWILWLDRAAASVRSAR